MGTFNFYINLIGQAFEIEIESEKKHGVNIYVHMFSAVRRMRTQKANEVDIGIAE